MADSSWTPLEFRYLRPADYKVGGGPLWPCAACCSLALSWVTKLKPETALNVQAGLYHCNDRVRLAAELEKAVDTVIHSDITSCERSNCEIWDMLSARRGQRFDLVLALNGLAGVEKLYLVKAFQNLCGRVKPGGHLLAVLRPAYLEPAIAAVGCWPEGSEGSVTAPLILLVARQANGKDN